MIKKIIFCFYISLFTSCTEKNNCDIIIPISTNEFDVEGLKGDFVFENMNGDTDSLILVNSINVLTDKSIKSIANYEECGHLIEFDYEFKKVKGTVEIRVHKREDEQYDFSIGGICEKKKIRINKKEIIEDTLYIVKFEKCNYSEIKEIALKKFKIEYLITQSGDIWRPIRFIGNKQG